MSTLRKFLGGSRRRTTASAAAAVLFLAGVAAIVVGVISQTSPPALAENAASNAGSSATRAPSKPAPESETGSGAPPAAGPDNSTRAPEGPVLPGAAPTSISSPAIDMRSPVFTVGQNSDGTIHVPQPGPNYDKAAWYKGSPTPGEQGPSVILGHIDSAENGPSVFFRLGAMRPGQEVSVTRSDGTVAVFTVDRVEKYDKDDFPTLEVYGNTRRAELRLITCGGTFNESTGNYRSNIVVYAHLTGSHPA